MQVTICPPSPNPETECSYVKPAQPVEAHYVGANHGINGWISDTSIGFDDYHHLQSGMKCKLNKGRRFVTPPWALNNRDLQRVILCYLENRAMSKKKRDSINPRMGLRRRLFIAERSIHERVPGLEKTIGELCARYVAAKNVVEYPATRTIEAILDSGSLKTIESAIRNLDSCLIFSQHPAAVVASVIFRYLRLGESSVEVAAATQLHPCGVRQMLRRIAIAASRCGFPPLERLQDRKSEPVRPFLEERAAARIAKRTARREARRAARLADRAARREARLLEKSLRKAAPAPKPAPKLAREKAERAANPVPKEVWKLNLSMAQKTAHARKHIEKRQAALVASIAKQDAARQEAVTAV